MVENNLKQIDLIKELGIQSLVPDALKGKKNYEKTDKKLAKKV